MIRSPERGSVDLDAVVGTEMTGMDVALGTGVDTGMGVVVLADSPQAVAKTLSATSPLKRVSALFNWSPLQSA